MLRLLVVCSGNTCRSPLAEGLLRRALGPTHASVTSAGVAATEGLSMTPEALACAVLLGVDAAEAARHRSRRLDAQLLSSAHLVLAMTREQRRAVATLHAGIPCMTLREFARGRPGPDGDPEDDDIADPYGLGPEVYARAGAEIAEAIDRATARLRAMVPPGSTNARDRHRAFTRPSLERGQVVADEP